MASESRLFSLSPGVANQIKDFRISGSKLKTAYLSFSISKATHEVNATDLIVIDEIDELVDELPDNTPRYVLVTYSMDHSDGRKSKPLFLVYWIPRTASTEMATLYASAKVWFSEKCDVSKVLEIRDADDLTTEYIEARLSGSK